MRARHRGADAKRNQGPVVSGEDGASVWTTVAGRLLHETQLWIIEAMLWTGEPQSASDLARSFSDGGADVREVAYHARRLRRLGVLKIVGSRKIRGATQTFYSVDVG